MVIGSIPAGVNAYAKFVGKQPDSGEPRRDEREAGPDAQAGSATKSGGQVNLSGQRVGVLIDTQA